jgi:hypothetical protein
VSDGPLGAATSKTAMELPPGGTWSFESTDVADFAVGYVAYATARFASMARETDAATLLCAASSPRWR